VRTDGFTGADLESLCKKATLLAIAEFQKQKSGAPFIVSRSDFYAVMEVRLKPDATDSERGVD
jgi:SpoVK/Ycf46/Vps4 family AAA+-type ATPase